MALIMSAPTSPVAMLRVAITNWWQRGTIARLTIQEREQLYHELWELWGQRSAEEKSCQRHQVGGIARPLYPAFESIRIELDPPNQQMLSVRIIDCCPGDESLQGSHTIMPRDYAVTRGQWSEICEIPLAQIA